MSVDDRQDQDSDVAPVEIELSDLGTVSEAAFEADRGDADRQAQRRAALERIEALDRTGRLLVDYAPTARHKRRSRPPGGASSTG
jgi:hypothetical protein